MKTSQIKLKNTANPPAAIGPRYFVTFLRKQDPFQKVIFCFEEDSFLAEQGNCVFPVTSFLGLLYKVSKTGWLLKKVLSLNSGSQKSEIKVQQGRAPFIALGEDPSLPLQAASVSWPSLMVQGLQTYHSSHMAISLCVSVSVSKFPFYWGILVLLDWELSS